MSKKSPRHYRWQLLGFRVAPAAVALAVAAQALGCTVRFSPKGKTGDGGLDARVDGSLDASTIPDGKVEPTDASGDGAVIPDAEVDAGCPPGTKRCDTSCVSVDSPATGCAQQSCEPCVFEHAAALCIGGACALGTCENQWGNCDTVAGNGCETDLTSTLEHCSACNNSCARPHANMSCQDGTCHFSGCQTDYENCDGNLELNGCEVYLKFDPSNCGSCNYQCYSGFECNNAWCRCYSNQDCDTGGGGSCDPTYRLCMCPTTMCDRPCHSSGSGCI
ncbi:MAG: hypothetical protein RBU30_02395 [Polyangia bacterium]|jgi:hypothetical protein|nr:hypothetical protein [Polyangia bacterium]